MHYHHSGSEEGVGDSCLPENRATEPFSANTYVLVQEDCLGQVVDGGYSDLQCSKGSGNVMGTMGLRPNRLVHLAGISWI